MARRLNAALAGAGRSNRSLAPGMNVMKTFEPPLEALVGREVTGVRRVGKMPVVEFGDLALLIHLMSAGRLRAFDKRASPKDRASRVLVRLEDGRELRLREFGTKQRAWAKLLPADAVAEDEMVASARARSLAPSPARRVRRGDRPAAPPAPAAAPPERHRRHRPLLGRRDPLGGAPLALQERLRTRRGGGRAAARGAARARRRDRPLRGDDRPRGPRQSADAAAGPQARGRALPALRHDDRGRLLLRAPDELLPARSRPAAGSSKTGGSRNCSSRRRGGRRNRSRRASSRRLKSRLGAEWVRAPIEMKSTPVSAIARTVSRSTPPEASRAGPSPAPAFSSRSLTAPRRVSRSMLSSSRRSAPTPRA